MKRLCFLSPDKAHARTVVQHLRDDGIPEKLIYVIAGAGTDPEDLPDAGPEGDDFLPAFERGVALGGTTGLFLGLAALLLRPAGIIAGGGSVLLIGLMGASLGGLLTGMAGAALPSSRLRAFEKDIEAGKILIMVDVPKSQAGHVNDLIRRIHPEVEIAGFEPPAPVIPR